MMIVYWVPVPDCKLLMQAKKKNIQVLGSRRASQSLENDQNVSFVVIQLVNCKNWYALCLLEGLGLDTGLVALDTLDDTDLFFFGQEASTSGVVGEEEEPESRADKGQDGGDDHEPLPLCGLLRGVDMGNTVGQEAGDDGSNAIALERPGNTLGYLLTGVEHGRDEHETGGD